MAPRLKERYVKEVAPALQKELGIDNSMAVPRLDKIVLNMGLGEAVGNPKIMDGAVDELSAIAGQRAVVTKAKKAIATYKLRAGMPMFAIDDANVATACTNLHVHRIATRAVTRRDLDDAVAENEGVDTGLGRSNDA